MTPAIADEANGQSTMRVRILFSAEQSRSARLALNAPLAVEHQIQHHTERQRQADAADQ
jgi:hypothetical protein